MRKRGMSLLLTAAMVINVLTGCGNSGGVKRQADRALPEPQ